MTGVVGEGPEVKKRKEGWNEGRKKQKGCEKIDKCEQNNKKELRIERNKC